MAEIRGEKVRFRKRDIVPLHDLPSARTHDPMIVHCPTRKTRLGWIMRLLTACALVLVLAVGASIAAIESGMLDPLLSRQAEAALNRSIGEKYQATVGSAAIRFSSGPRLALEARDVDIRERASGLHLTRTGAVRMAIDPVAVMRGRFAIGDIEAEKIDIDTALLPSGAPLDPASLRVDALPGAVERIFTQLDDALAFIQRNGTGSVTVSGLSLHIPTAPEATPLTVDVLDLRMTRALSGNLQLRGRLKVNGADVTAVVDARSGPGGVETLSAKVTGFPVTPFALEYADGGIPHQGVDGEADVTVDAKRATSSQSPSIRIGVSTQNGMFYSDGIEQELTSAALNLDYDFAKSSIEIDSSEIRFGPTVLPLSGGIIDLDKLEDAAGQRGFGLDLLISGATALANGSGEEPASFDMKAYGRYIADDSELSFSALQISSPLGNMAGSLKVRFGEGSPEISFGAQLPTMQTTGIKQLWPYWMARKPRDWVMANLFGGTLTNASIAVFIPAGRMLGPGHPLQLDENELRIAFDITDTRLNLSGDIPPLRNLDARFDLKGKAMSVAVSKAASFFPSGRSVTIERASFAMPSTYDKPLMGQLKIDVAGNADAITELASFRPVKALDGTPYKPEDFSGAGRAGIEATFGLISDQKPPRPVWKAGIDLNGVSLMPAVSNRKVSDLVGRLDIDMQAAVLKAKGRIDGIPMDIAMTEPVGEGSSARKSLTLKGDISDEQRDLLAPGLGDLVTGGIGLTLDRLGETTQAISLDLKNAVLSVPGVGWSKGRGIPATASFELADTGTRTELRKFELSGDGFGATGSIVMGAKGALVSADFDRVKLSVADDFAVSIKRGKASYDIAISGASADIRPLISSLREPGSRGGSDDKSGSVSVKAKLDKVYGFNDVSLSGVTAQFAQSGSRIDQVDISAAIGRQALVSRMVKGDGRNTLTLTSGDAGAVARFLDVYSNMRGGLLNLALVAGAGGAWNGSLDIRNFAVSNEQRLQKIVSTPTGGDGRSLNGAVKRDIDVSSEQFQRGFAYLSYRDGTLAVENGIVRGEQIGTTFQGVLRDRQGNMDITGTFMPAYGLNRLFGEVPIIGAILGNGRDRGLLGITFKATGKFDNPKLNINPLSIIAPGVFRQIFEFQ